MSDEAKILFTLILAVSVLVLCGMIYNYSITKAAFEHGLCNQLQIGTSSPQFLKCK